MLTVKTLFFPTEHISFGIAICGTLYVSANDWSARLASHEVEDTIALMLAFNNEHAETNKNRNKEGLSNKVQ